MNERLRTLLESVRQFYLKLSKTKKIALAAGIVATAVGIGIVTAIVQNDPYVLLYSDLQPEESRSVAKKLSELRIPYRVAEDNTVVYVPSSKVHESRMQLAKDGMPGQDVVGFEKFDGSTLGMSSYVQRIQYVRAVQGELTRSIQRLASVKRARVHISVPPKKTFLEEQDPPKASVVLELRPGQIPSKPEVVGIAHLVASAVEGLKVNQVTIVDNRGNFLHRPEDNGNPALSSALLEMQRSIESEYEKRVEDLLIPVVGLGKVRAKITAEMDPSRINTTEETFDADRAVPRTTLKTDESNTGSKPNPMGIAGSRSNLPGTEVDNPPVPMASTSSEKNTTNTSYAIPRKIQVTDKPSGSIKRLTVAVVVDGNYTKVGGPKGTETFAPRSEEELKRIQEVVANAVGYDPQRRDSITVTSMPFRAADLLPPEEALPGAVVDSTQLTWKNGLIGLGIALLTLIALKLVMRGGRRKEDEAEITVFPKTVAELEAGASLLGEGSGKAGSEDPLALAKGITFAEDPEPVEKQEESELRKRIEERLQKSPRKGFHIIQDWLDEEAGLQAAEG